VVLALDRSVHAWPMTSTHGQLVAALPMAASTLAIDPTGERLVVGGEDGSLWLVPARGGAERRRLDGLRGSVTALAFSPDGASVAAGCEEGMVGLWTATGEPRWLEDLEAAVIRRVSFSSRGDELAVAAYRRGPVRLDAATGQPRATLAGTRTAGVELLADGRLLAWSHDGWVGLWAADGTVLLRRELEDELWVARASPAGDALVVAGRDGRLRRYALPGGEETLAEQTGSWVDLAFVDAGSRLVTVGNDQRLQLWDAQTLALLRTFEGQHAHVGAFVVRSDATRMVSVGLDGSGRIWDLATAESRRLLGHQGAVKAVVLTPDGRAAITAGRDGTVRRWPDDVPDDEAGLRGWLEQELARGR
jgi:eukaryotic-like serine/threonine-protein kinase